MPLRSTDATWGWGSQFFHWASALAILATAFVGLTMEDVDALWYYSLHKSLGMSVLGLVVLRLLWRLVDRRPPYPAGMPAWQRLASSGAHALIYAAMLVMPISGWLYNSAARRPLDWFGVFKIPSLTALDRETQTYSVLGFDAPAFIDTPQKLRALAGDVHESLFYAGAVLIALHVAAALKHHFFDRDATLARMLPGLASPAAPASPASASDAGPSAQPEAASTAHPTRVSEAGADAAKRTPAP
jgi:cytochrome b561